ncbi:MAG TPA: FAD:protein FMN transferase [Vicinamibacterales bacterium]|nr:FAD:protein FMN transferase [Vicinamibacterales bacterium]
MNTGVGVWLCCADAKHGAAVAPAMRRAEEFFHAVDAELSRFRPASALSELNRASGQGPRTVSPILWTVLVSALHAAHESGGIYDPTILRSLERIGYDRSFEAIRAAGPVEGDPAAAFGSWRRVRLDSAARSVSLPGDLALDLGGIAKGWTVDQVALALAPLGPTLVDAGGDLRVAGRPDRDPWPIGVQDAFNPERDRAVVRLRDGALATSSVGGRRWQRGTRMLHHVIDPRTGTSAGSDLHSVTVRARTAMIADVAAKVTLVLGSVPGASYLRQRSLGAWLTTMDGRDIIVGEFPWEEVESHASLHRV